MQVYRARLTQQYGGGEVAVKVQRPEVRKSVALDLLLMRQLAVFAQRFPQACTGAHYAAHSMLSRKGSNYYPQCYSCPLLQRCSMPAGQACCSCTIVGKHKRSRTLIFP